MVPRCSGTRNKEEEGSEEAALPEDAAATDEGEKATGMLAAGAGHVVHAAPGEESKEDEGTGEAEENTQAGGGSGSRVGASGRARDLSLRPRHEDC